MLTSVGIPGLILLLFILFLLVLPIMLAIWGYKDAIKKGKSSGFSLGIALMILFLPIIGIIIYLFIRND